MSEQNNHEGSNPYQYEDEKLPESNRKNKMDGWVKKTSTEIKENFEDSWVFEFSENSDSSHISFPQIVSEQDLDNIANNIKNWLSQQITNDWNREFNERNLYEFLYYAGGYGPETHMRAVKTTVIDLITNEILLPWYSPNYKYHKAIIELWNDKKISLDADLTRINKEDIPVATTSMFLFLAIIAKITSRTPKQIKFHYKNNEGEVCIKNLSNSKLVDLSIESDIERYPKLMDDYPIWMTGDIWGPRWFLIRWLKSMGLKFS